jgi:polysaccharide biosynthesis protein
MITTFWNLLKKALSKGLLHMFSANYLTQILAFGSLIFVSKVLTPEELGAVKIIQGYIAVCTIFALLGRHTAIIKFCAETKDVPQRNNILKQSMISSFFASIVIIFFVNMMNLYGWVSQDNIVREWILWYSFAILLSGIYTLCITYMQACKEFKRMATIQSAVKLTSVFIVVAATNQYGLTGYITAVLATMLLSLLPLAQQIGISFLKQKSYSLPKGFLFLANVSILSSAVGTIGMYADMFFLDHFIDDRVSIGFYALATILIMIGTQFVGTVQGFLTPFFAERSHDGRWLWAATKRYQVYLSFVALALCCGVYLLGEMLVQFYYGASYEEMLLFLTILLGRFLLQSGYAIFGIALLSINKEQYNCGVSAANLMIRCVLSYVLLSSYGIVGLAIAQVLTEAVVVVLEYVVTYRVFRQHFGAANLS